VGRRRQEKGVGTKEEAAGNKEAGKACKEESRLHVSF